ncbi:hypothetical protein RhiirA5_432131 [Rhizophagus irregularis]|uniref:BZIP domain-containing protein n=1 Tax=Rhizophagus irregularis TaxID=588596 RepID=A0A2I1HJU6_9GLOM|nr:hypothetical protein RhiirA5_432134 [Rhizophagus irregularis]PKB98005.1 hypothetical protein RhiirA5_432131 [Rhizophagus irregularis]PKY59139.1 hypothetical protein RhiirA4_430202 [Rhizophagus irregularis]CAB5217514.1 unnamed protein product [Rhizophagus irregularis]
MEKKESYEISEDNPLLKTSVVSTKDSSSEDIQQNQSLCKISSSSSRSSKFSNNIDKKILQNERNERKRMLNRKAAARLRQKKKKEIKELQDSNISLRDEIEQVESIIMKLRQQIMDLEIKEE